MQHSRRRYTLDDYFTLQRGVEIKLEFFDGEIYAMAGGSANHNRISRNVLNRFTRTLHGSRCEPFGSDMRVATPSGLYTYPDASIVCGERTDGRAETLSNPVVIVEVLSDSTRDYDRGEKFELYRSIAALRHVLLIEQSSMHVEHRYLGDDGMWSREERMEAQESVHLAAVGVEIPVDAIYEGVDLSP